MLRGTCSDSSTADRGGSGTRDQRVRSWLAHAQSLSPLDRSNPLDSGQRHGQSKLFGSFIVDDYDDDDDIVFSNVENK